MRRTAPMRTIVLSVLVVAGALSIAFVQAQQNAAAMQIEKVKDGLYVVTGGRGLGAQAGGVAGNSTVFVADSGLVLIDTKFPGLGKAILDQIKSVTSKPITTIINTHTHGDHTGGNSEFPRTIEFVAQENTKTNMARMDEFKGENAAFLPKRDVQGQTVAAHRPKPDRSVLLRAPDTPMATRSSSFRRCAPPSWATCSRGSGRRWSTRPTAAARWRFPKRSRRRSAASRMSTR